MKRQAMESSAQPATTAGRDTLLFRRDPFVLSNFACAQKRATQAFDQLQFAEMDMRSLHSNLALLSPAERADIIKLIDNRRESVRGIMQAIESLLEQITMPRIEPECSAGAATATPSTPAPNP